MMNTQSLPLVSVIVPCYNQEEFIDEALLSVYNQTYTNWECIIVNDGSTDKSEEKIQVWVNKDSRFHYVYKENNGVAEARNSAIKLAKGEFIVPLDGDDKLHENYIYKAIEIHNQYTEIKAVYCDPILFGAKQEHIRSGNYDYLRLLVENTIPCTGIYRKSDFEMTNGYQSNMKYGLEDWDFWVSLLNEEDKVVKLKDNLVYYRIKEVSRSKVLKKENEKNEAMILQIFKNNQEKYLKYFNPIRDHINHLYYKKEYKRLQQTTEYKIGKIIYSPIRLINRIFNKLFR